MGKQLRQGTLEQASLSEEEVRKRLEDELERLLRGRCIEECINPLLGLAGKYHAARLILHM